MIFRLYKEIFKYTIDPKFKLIIIKCNLDANKLN